MISVKYLEESDRDFWYSIDRDLPEIQFQRKIRDRQGYVISDDGVPVGLLRYCLMWDNTPFCSLLYISTPMQRKGYGREIMKFWENDMRFRGFGLAMVSTQVNEEAQHFYRKIGYADCGGLILDIPGYEQPMEMFMIKRLK